MTIPTANFTASLCATNVPLIVALVVVCVVAVVAFIYGVIKRFSRMSWTGLQIPVVFGLTQIIKVLPATMNPTVRFSIAVGGFFSFTVLVLLLGALIKKAFRRREDTRTEKPRAAALAFDRLFGGVLALFDWLILFLVIAGVGLSVGAVAGAEKALPAVYESGLWQKFLKNFVYDLFFISVLLLVIKGGYRLGVVKGIWTVLSFALTAVAVFGALLCTIRLPFLHSLALKIGATIKMNRLIADLIGHLVAAGLCFLVFFIVIILLTVVGNLIVKGLTRSPVFNAIDGCVSSVLFFAVAIVFAMGIGVGVAYLERGIGGLGDYGQVVSKIGAQMREILTSSFFRAIIYENNPLLKLLG